MRRPATVRRQGGDRDESMPSPAGPPGRSPSRYMGSGKLARIRKGPLIRACGSPQVRHHAGRHPADHRWCHERHRRGRDLPGAGAGSSATAVPCGRDRGHQLVHHPAGANPRRGADGARVEYGLPASSWRWTRSAAFDSTYSVPPPANLDGSRYVTVRYDPSDVTVFLPVSTFEHPSYPRITRQIIVGSALCAAALLAIFGWLSRERRRLARAASGWSGTTGQTPPDAVSTTAGVR